MKINKKIQSGRSMVEMLGVLAIIGVLSIGGIAGYSMAMEKYRINITISNLQLLIQEIRTAFANEENFYALGHSTTRGSLASTMLSNVASNRPHEITIHGYDYTFNIVINDLTQSTCVAITSQNWNAYQNSSVDFNENHSISDMVNACNKEGDENSLHLAVGFDRIFSVEPNRTAP